MTTVLEYLGPGTGSIEAPRQASDAEGWRHRSSVGFDRLPLLTPAVADRSRRCIEIPLRRPTGALTLVRMPLPWRRRRSAAPRRPTLSPVPVPSPPLDIDHLPDWLSRLVLGAPGLNETVAALGRLLRGAPLSSLGRLDARARSWTRWDDGGWRSLTPSDMQKLLLTTADPLAVAAATSMHSDGYVREAAVRLLATMTSGEELRWLLLRCTDWVPEVRSAAIDAVRARCRSVENHPRYTGDLVGAVALIDSERFRYEEFSALRSDLGAALASPASREAVRAATHDPDRLTRRAAVRILISVEPTIDLLRGQLAVGDVVAASAVATELLEIPAVSDQVARFLLTARLARLRELGLWHLLAQEDDDESLVNGCLLDPAPRVRDVAQRHASGQGRNVADWYRGHLSQYPFGALLGLGDVGGPQDLPTAQAHARSVHTRTRAAAVRVIARFGSPAVGPRLLEIAAADTGRVAREALAGLRRLGVSEELARVAWDRATDPTTPQSGRRRMFVRLLPLASRWIATELALRALIHPDEEISELGASLLAHTATTWNQSWTAPTPAQLDMVRALVDETQRAMDREQHGALLEEFRDIVGRWK